MNNETVWLTILGPVILAVIGGALIVRGWLYRRQAQAAQEWHPASGVVTATRLKKHYRRGGVDYEPHVEYTYTIMGAPYEGKRLCFGPMRINQRRAMEKLAIYPPDGKTVVYYNPDKPTESVLERQAPEVGKLMLSGALILLLALGWLFFPYVSGLLGL